MSKIADLIEKNGRLVKNCHDMINEAEKEGKPLTGEKEIAYDKMRNEIADNKAFITQLTQQMELDREAAAVIVPDPITNQKTFDPKMATGDQIMSAYGRALASGHEQLPNTMTKQDKLILNALQKDLDTEGGFTVPPEEFVRRLIKKVDDLLFIRQLATTILLTTADGIGAPQLTADPSDGDWTSEIGDVPEDTAMKFGKRQMSPHVLVKLIKVSKDLIRLSALPIEQLVIDRLAYKFALTQEKAFLTGTGANQPLGLFVASINGLSTAVDVRAASATSLGVPDIIDLKYALKTQYRSNARWLVSRPFITAVSKLVGTNGHFLWQDNLSSAQPDRLVGLPVMESENVPATFAIDQYVAILGDFSHYWIVDGLNMSFQRLIEKYANTRQIGFIGDLTTDGAPVLEEAFARLQMAQS